MRILRILYSPRGRIARLPYFGYSCLNILIFVLVIVIPIVLLRLVAGPGETLSAAGQFTVSLAPPSAWAGLVVLLSIVVALATLVSAVILTIKRLHDLGHSGWHVIWIIVLTTGTSSSSARHVSVVSVVLDIIGVCVSLWLLFDPGDPATNAYGPVPS
jgi:uncharacterized membrane protein YhaH (DUF805 family)